MCSVKAGGGLFASTPANLSWVGQEDQILQPHGAADSTPTAREAGTSPKYDDKTCPFYVQTRSSYLGEAGGGLFRSAPANLCPYFFSP